MAQQLTAKLMQCSFDVTLQQAENTLHIAGVGFKCGQDWRATSVPCKWVRVKVTVRVRVSLALTQNLTIL